MKTEDLKGRFQVIACDCPWRFKNWSMDEFAKRGEAWCRRNGRSPYQVLDTSYLCELPIKQFAAKDCLLAMWATYPKLEDAFQVMKAWEFKFVTVGFTWVKLNPSGKGYHFGLGYYSRGNPEIVLFGKRGHPKRKDNSVANLIVTPRRDHSRKPEEFYSSIERLMPGPYLDLFSRPPLRPNWTQIGEELGTLITPDGIVEIETEVEPLDALAQNAVEEYQASRTRNLEELARENNIPLEDECEPPTPRMYTQLSLPGTVIQPVKSAAAEI